MVLFLLCMQCISPERPPCCRRLSCVLSSVPMTLSLYYFVPFCPSALHPAPILTVGIKAHHFGLVWCYTEDKKYIVRFFVEMFQSCLIILLQTNSATFLIPAMTGCFIQDSFSMPPPQRRILLLCLLFH